MILKKVKMGEKADLQGQKLYVMLYVLSFVYWIGERYLNLETAKDMMFWERGSVFASTEDGSLSMCLRSMCF